MKSKATKAIVMLCFGAFVTTGVVAPASAASLLPWYSSDSRYHKESKSERQKRIDKERKEREKRYEQDRKEREKRIERDRKEREKQREERRKQREQDRKDREKAKERKKSYWGKYDHRSQESRTRAHMGPDASH